MSEWSDMSTGILRSKRFGIRNSVSEWSDMSTGILRSKRFGIRNSVSEWSDMSTSIPDVKIQRVRIQ